jgi:multiple sugar transport system permease protein
MTRRMAVHVTTVSAAVVVLILMTLPVILIFLTALKKESEIVHFEGMLPREWTLENFRQLLQNREEIPLIRWLANSIMISTSVTALVLLVDSLAAYGLARLELPGRRLIFALIIATLMIPGQILLVPVYMILDWLRWIDTPLALIIPAGAGAFGVFLLHQFFLGIPRDLEDAALMDGCTRFGIWWRIALPLSRAALATLGIFTFIGSWNDFIGPLIFIDSLSKYTLPVGVALFQSSYRTEYGLTLAASVLCTAPALLVFLVLQKNIIRGIALTGLKE